MEGLFKGGLLRFARNDEPCPPLHSLVAKVQERKLLRFETFKIIT